jgi:hypothetical protein
VEQLPSFSSLRSSASVIIFTGVAKLILVFRERENELAIERDSYDYASKATGLKMMTLWLRMVLPSNQSVIASLQGTTSLLSIIDHFVTLPISLK